MRGLFVAGSMVKSDEHWVFWTPGGSKSFEIPHEEDRMTFEVRPGARTNASSGPQIGVTFGLVRVISHTVFSQRPVFHAVELQNGQLVPGGLEINLIAPERHTLGFDRLIGDYHQLRMVFGNAAVDDLSSNIGAAFAARTYPRAHTHQDLTSNYRELRIVNEGKRYRAALGVLSRAAICTRLYQALPESARTAENPLSPLDEMANLRANAIDVMHESAAWLTKVQHFGRGRLERDLRRADRILSPTRKVSINPDQARLWLIGREFLVIEEFKQLARFENERIRHALSFLCAPASKNHLSSGPDHTQERTDLRDLIQSSFARMDWAQTHFGWMRNGSARQTRYIPQNASEATRKLISHLSLC